MPGLRNLFSFMNSGKAPFGDFQGQLLGSLWVFVNSNGSCTRGAGAVIAGDCGNDCVRSGEAVNVGGRKLTIDDGSIAEINHAAGYRAIISPAMEAVI